MSPTDAMPHATRGRRSARGIVPDERRLIARLRGGDEEAFLALVARHNAMLLRIAGSVLGDRAVAEEAVQDTWLAVLRGIDTFEGRSSLRTWIVQILINRARSAGSRERRTVPVGDPAAAVDASRFDASGPWTIPPQHWIEDTDDRVDASSMGATIRAALAGLPPAQRDVVTLRDVDGLSSEEVCATLGISEGNQRVLLHRARRNLRGSVALRRHVS